MIRERIFGFAPVNIYKNGQRTDGYRYDGSGGPKYQTILSIHLFFDCQVQNVFFSQVRNFYHFSTKGTYPFCKVGIHRYSEHFFVDNVDKSVNKSTSRRTWIRVNVENPDCGKRLQDAWEYHKKHREQSIFVKNA